MLRAFKQVCKCYADGDADEISLKPIEVDLDHAKCPSCKKTGDMVRHSKYQRRLIRMAFSKPDDTIIDIEVLHCRSCKHFHALLPLVVIPHLSYSVTFIAYLMGDWLDRRFACIDSLCEHYRISVKTFLRLRKRFIGCVAILCGVTDARNNMHKVVLTLMTPDTIELAGFLYEFFTITARSFCQTLPP